MSHPDPYAAYRRPAPGGAGGEEPPADPAGAHPARPGGWSAPTAPVPVAGGPPPGHPGLPYGAPPVVAGASSGGPPAEPFADGDWFRPGPPRPAPDDGPAASGRTSEPAGPATGGPVPAWPAADGPAPGRAPDGGPAPAWPVGGAPAPVRPAGGGPARFPDGGPAPAGDAPAPAWPVGDAPAPVQQPAPGWPADGSPGPADDRSPADGADGGRSADDPDGDGATARGPGRRRAGRSRDAAAGGRSRGPGRNLPAAIGVGVGLGALALLPLLFYKPAFVVVVAAAAGVGVAETTRALRAGGARAPLPPLLGGTLLTIGTAWYAGLDGLVLGLAATVLAAVVWRLADGVADLGRDVTAVLLTAVYVPFLLGFGVLLVLPDDGRWRVLGALIAVVLSDTGGYAAGVRLGRHPMSPRISPNKSWEGFAGSVTAAALGSAVFLGLVLDVPVGWGLLFGAAVSVAAVLGDLAESMLKRDLGIKDMSRLLPGHGGLMDRLDSILFAVPTAYLLLALIAPAA